MSKRRQLRFTLITFIEASRVASNRHAPGCRNLYAPPDRFPERVTSIGCITALCASVSLYRRIRGGLLSLLLRIQQHHQV
jgi:hypothetical protein